MNLLRVLNKFVSAANRFRSSIFALAILIAIIIFTAQTTGIFELLESNLLDKFFQIRASEGMEARIVMITFDDVDISKIGKWPFSDAVVAKMITKVRNGKPRVIGLDVYRNIPVDSGFEELKSVLQSTPNLIVAEKIVQPSVSPPNYISYDQQVGFVDVMVDEDGIVRRGLLSVEKDGGEIVYSFAIKIALQYLRAENISPQISTGSDRAVTLGKAKILPYQSGYEFTDDGGYQTLMNYRCRTDCFQSISMTDVLAGKYPQNLFENRIVLIGSTAESLRDFFLSPYGKIPGVYIHANLISQIVNGAINGRPFLQTSPKWIEGILVLLSSFVGVNGISSFLRLGSLGKSQFIIGIITFLSISVFGLLVISYLSFLLSLWLPIVPTVFSFLFSSVISIIYLSEKFRYASNIDELTQIANRRYFDRFLHKNFNTKKDLSVILCDIDHFKLYNDSYGHQSGDLCLKQVASAIAKSVRSGELAGRYGGEEFAVVLPDADFEAALSVAERIVMNVRSLNIPHKSSKTSNIVTLSCGIATMTVEDGSSLDLLIRADRALYKAKELGRDRAVGSDQV
ncbi:CHASE2 domain-containing protein [Pseudanabaena yagii]|uniref:CHASE2 domain-containing protein n=1 Tax=Pseudanabaena yagii GIHE-NHR1 TaxID=2722753 RepID=A0ABX1LWX0_9CYAN|nr:CHASE2 domain-containing protein [Pseudanabaena yagii]NMF59486.1 CHASE2 domain-containing protein [Pseudanabaena yagii GIHE-NHR1]